MVKWVSLSLLVLALVGTRVALAIDCDQVPDKLDACEAYRCQFLHPFTKTMMKKEIVGKVGEKCRYLEEMPNNGKMECLYREDTRHAIAQEYRALATAKTTSSKVKFVGDSKSVGQYKIDGKSVKSPLQESMNNGECKISGY